MSITKQLRCRYKEHDLPFQIKMKAVKSVGKIKSYEFLKIVRKNLRSIQCVGFYGSPKQMIFRAGKQRSPNMLYTIRKLRSWRIDVDRRLFSRSLPRDMRDFMCFKN